MCWNVLKTLSEVISGRKKRNSRQESQDLAQAVHVNSAEVGAGHPSKGQFLIGGGDSRCSYLCQPLCIRCSAFPNS